jgi:hypothetical protein
VQAEIGGGAGSGSATKLAAKAGNDDATARPAADEKNAESRPGLSPRPSSGTATAARPAAKPAVPATARPTSAAAAARGSLIDQAAGTRESVERSQRRGIPPFVMWLMTIVAMLIVSLVALLVFYYLIAKFTSLHDFLHLNLPGLEPPKAKPTALLDFLIRASSFFPH